MVDNARLTAGAAADVESRATPSDAQNSLHMHINARTPLLQESNVAPGYRRSSLPNDGTEASQTEPKKAWRTPSVGSIMIVLTIQLALISFQ